MTPEERAEARPLTATPVQICRDLALNLEINPALLKRGAIPDDRLRRLLFEAPTAIRGVLDALEAVERERDEAQKMSCQCGYNEACGYVVERDAARAQVKTLAEALREIAEDAIDIDGRNGERARTALKAAGVET